MQGIGGGGIEVKQNNKKKNIPCIMIVFFKSKKSLNLASGFQKN